MSSTTKMIFEGVGAISSNEWLELSFHEKCRIALSANQGEIWTSNKTGRMVTVIGNSHGTLRLKHKTGRVTQKQHHYFAYDYSPKEKVQNLTQSSKHQTQAGIDLPRYLCHKTVWALKIAAIELDSDKAKSENRETDGSATITPADEGYAPFRVGHEYVHKHKPEVGGYYVVYADGYRSYSPAKAFEDGYARVP